MTRHRKLYPTLTPSNSNETECSDCSDPYSFYYKSPPPPPIPPLPSPSIFYGDDGGDKSIGVSPPIIVLFALLSSFLLLLLYYIVIAKSCFGLCKRRRNYEGDLLAGSESDGGDQQAGGENRSAVDHPIWFITTVGLQQSIINSITVLKYRKSEGLIEGTDCSVCLSEFREDETVRLLPKCSHAFHVTCIDTWLRSHTNCPLCRANIVSTNINNNNNNNNNNNEQSLISQANSRGSLDLSAVRNDSNRNSNDNRNDDRVEEIVSNDDNGVGRREENDVVRLTVVRRWVSMDDIDIRVDDDGDNELGGGQKREDKFARMIRLSPVAMKKRSLSCGGLRLLSSRYSNNSYQLTRINSILPS